MTVVTTKTGYLSVDQFNKLLREEESPASGHHSSDAYKALRKPQPPEVLQRLAFSWLARLPEKVRPIELGRVYPRIANRLAAIWIDPSVTAKYLEDLLVDGRGGRRGFPTAIDQELRKLRYHHTQVSDFSDTLWSEDQGRSRFKEGIA